MKDNVEVRRKGVMPKFIIHFWDVTEEKLAQNWTDVPKKFARHYWEGRIEHVQSGETKLFHSVGDMITFMEKRRIPQ